MENERFCLAKCFREKMVILKVSSLRVRAFLKEAATFVHAFPFDGSRNWGPELSTFLGSRTATATSHCNTSVPAAVTDVLLRESLPN